MARIDIDVEMLDELVKKAILEELELIPQDVNNDLPLLLSMFGSCVRHNLRNRFNKIAN